MFLMVYWTHAQFFCCNTGDCGVEFGAPKEPHVKREEKPMADTGRKHHSETRRLYPHRNFVHNDLEYSGLHGSVERGGAAGDSDLIGSRSRLWHWA
jgi:hypothetical protein